MPLINLDDDEDLAPSVIDLDDPAAPAQPAAKPGILARMGRALMGEALGDPVRPGEMDPSVNYGGAPGFAGGSQMAASLIAQQINSWLRGKTEANPVVRTGYQAAALLPGIGPAAQRIGEALGEGDVAGAATRAAVNFPPVAGARRLVQSGRARVASAAARRAALAEEQAVQSQLDDVLRQTNDPMIEPPPARETMYEGPAERRPPLTGRQDTPSEPLVINLDDEGADLNLGAADTGTVFGGRTTVAGQPDKRTIRRTEQVPAPPDTRTGQLTESGFATVGDEEVPLGGRRDPTPPGRARTTLADEGGRVIDPEPLESSGADMGPDYVRSVLNTVRRAIPAAQRRAGVNTVQAAGRTYVAYFDAEGNLLAAGIGGDGKITDMAKATRLFSEAERAGIDTGQRAEATQAAEGVRSALHDLGFESTVEGRSPDAARAEARYRAKLKGQGFLRPVEDYDPSLRGNAVKPSDVRPQKPPSTDAFTFPRATPEEGARMDLEITRPGREIRLPEDQTPQTPTLAGGGRGVLERNVRPMEDVIERVPEAGPELARKHTAYRTDEETLASTALADLKTIQRSLPSRDSQKAVLRALEGEKPSSPAIAEAVKGVRSILDRMHALADELGIAARFEADYLPHFFEGKDFGGQVRTGIKRPNTTGVVPRLERERTVNAAGYRLEWDVLERYMTEGSRRIAQARHFGPDMEKIRATTAGVGMEGGLADWVTTAFNRIAQVEPRTAGDRARVKGSSAIRQFQALADLGLSGIMQLGNQAFVMSEVGLKNYARTLGSVARDVMSHQGRTDLLVNSIRSGALFPNVSHEISVALSGKRGFLWGVPTADKAGRIIAQRAGEIMAKYNGGRPMSPSEVTKAGRALSDKTQFRVHAGRMPLWASSPEGRLVTQYASFMGEYTRYVANLFRKGEWSKVGRLLGVAAPVMGEIISDAKEFLRGRDLWGDDNPENWEAILRSRRVAPGTPRGLVLRYLQNVATVGGGGLFQTAVERFLDMKQNPLAWVGRAGSTAVEGGEAVGALIDRGDPAPAVRFGTRTAPAGGFWGTQVNREFIPTKKQEDLGPDPTPGWVGRVRDKVDPLDETGAVRADERRKTQALIEARRIEKENLGQVEGMRPESPVTSADTKIGKSKRNAMRLSLEREIRTAIASGDNGKARRLTRAAKLRHKLNFPVEEWIRGFEPDEEE